MTLRKTPMAAQPYQQTVRSILLKATAISIFILAVLCLFAPTRTKRKNIETRPMQSRLPSDYKPSPSTSQSGRKFLFCRSQQKAPFWAVAYGQEFWRNAAAQGEVSKLSTANKLVIRDSPSIDLNDIIDRVSHAFSSQDSGTTAIVRSGSYVVRFEGEAFHFSPVQNSDDETFDSSNKLDLEAKFFTRSVRSGDHILYNSDQSASCSTVLGNTAQVLLEPQNGLIEHFEARGEGVAVSWIMNQPLPKNGDQASDAPPDLIVEAELSGLSYIGRTAAGSHFADAGGTARLVFGNARVVDSGGQTWEVPVTVEENSVRLTVPGVVLTRAQYPIALDPVIGPEFGIDNPIFGPSNIPERKPAIASNGRTYLVVWESLFSPAGGLPPPVTGCRVTGGGTVLDLNGIPIPSRLSVDLRPAVRVASDGTDFFVVWQELRSVTNVIAAVRVSSDGVVLDTNSIVLRMQRAAMLNPSVAGQSNGYLVAWQDARNLTNDIFGARVSPAGIVLDTNNLALSRAPGAQNLPAIAASAGDFLVVWQDWRNAGVTNSPTAIYGTRVTGAGEVLDTNGFFISASATNSGPAVAAMGPDYLVVWPESSLGKTSIQGTRLTHDGLIVDTNHLVLGTSGSPQAPSVAASSSRYLVVWQASARTNFTFPTNIFGNIVPAAGPVLFTNGFRMTQPTTNQVLPAVAGNGTNFFVVWQDSRVSRAFPGNTFGTPVSLEGNALNPNGIPLIPGANPETDPAVAFDGKNYLAVWSDARNSLDSDIYGARIATDGSVLDPNGIAICTATNRQFSVAVAASAGMFFTVWVDYRNGFSGTPGDIFGARITDAGIVLDTNSIAICTVPTIQVAPAVVAGSNAFLVVWANQLIDGNGYNLLGTLVGLDGNVAVPNGAALTADNVDVGQGYPAVAFNGSEYLIVWSDARNIEITGYDILGLRIDQLGAPIDSTPLTICSRDGYDTNPALASNGTDFLAVWADFTTNSHIYAARVTASGGILDPDGFMIENSLGGDHPAVASDGTGYLVIWQAATNILGTRISAGGNMLDSPALAIDTNMLSQTLPSLAYGGEGQFLAVNQGTMFRTPRAVGEFVTVPFNHPPVPVPKISPLFSILPTETNLYVLSPDGISATVLFDASQSYDVDDQSLNFTWYVDGHTNLAGTGMFLTNMLPIGLHSLQLVVRDGFTSSTAGLTFEIISPGVAVDQLLLLTVDDDTFTGSQRPLLASLNAAEASFESGHFQAGVNQLGAFKNKVEAQIAPGSPTLASQLTSAAALISETVAGSYNEL